MPIKKYSKVKFTLRKELVIILAVVVVMLVATILLQQPTKKEKFQNAWSTAGVSNAENSVMVSSTFSKLEGTVKNSNDELVFVYFATTSNSDSVKYYDVVYSLASALEIKTIYLVDAKFATESDRNTDEEFDAKLKEIEAKFTDGTTTIDLSYVPNLWVFQNGKLVKEINHDKVETEGDWYAAAFEVLSLAKQGK